MHPQLDTQTHSYFLLHEPVGSPAVWDAGLNDQPLFSDRMADSQVLDTYLAGGLLEPGAIEAWTWNLLGALTLAESPEVTGRILGCAAPHICREWADMGPFLEREVPQAKRGFMQVNVGPQKQLSLLGERVRLQVQLAS